MRNTILILTLSLSACTTPSSPTTSEPGEDTLAEVVTGDGVIFEDSGADSSLNVDLVEPQDMQPPEIVDETVGPTCEAAPTNTACTW